MQRHAVDGRALAGKCAGRRVADNHGACCRAVKCRAAACKRPTDIVRAGAGRDSDNGRTWPCKRARGRVDKSAGSNAGKAGRLPWKRPSGVVNAGSRRCRNDCRTLPRKSAGCCVLARSGRSAGKACPRPSQRTGCSECTKTRGRSSYARALGNQRPGRGMRDEPGRAPCDCRTLRGKHATGVVRDSTGCARCTAHDFSALARECAGCAMRCPTRCLIQQIRIKPPRDLCFRSPPPGNLKGGVKPSVHDTQAQRM